MSTLDELVAMPPVAPRSGRGLYAALLGDFEVFVTAVINTEESLSTVHYELGSIIHYDHGVREPVKPLAIVPYIPGVLDDICRWLTPEESREKEMSKEYYRNLFFPRTEALQLVQRMRQTQYTEDDFNNTSSVLSPLSRRYRCDNGQTIKFSISSFLLVEPNTFNYRYWLSRGCPSCGQWFPFVDFLNTYSVQDVPKKRGKSVDRFVVLGETDECQQCLGPLVLPYEQCVGPPVGLRVGIIHDARGEVIQCFNRDETGVGSNQWRPLMEFGVRNNKGKEQHLSLQPSTSRHGARTRGYCPV